MDKMQEKPLAERQRLLAVSSILLGAIVLVVGLWNISSNIVALNSSDGSDLAQVGATVGDVTSVMDKLRIQAASIWGNIQSGFQILNNNLGSDQQKQVNE